MSYKRWSFLWLFLPVFFMGLSPENVRGQDIAYVRSVVDVLCSSRMHGRGYAKKGDIRASGYIQNEYKHIGIRTFDQSYYQPFTISVNTFPGAMNLRFNGKSLVPGREFIIGPASPGIKGTFDPFNVSVRQLAGNATDVILNSITGKVLVIDGRSWDELSAPEKTKVNDFRKLILSGNSKSIKAVFELTREKLSFGISGNSDAIPYCRVMASACPDSITDITARIRNRYLDARVTRNVAGYIQGTEYPDSFIVFTAHYDHLGLMGRKTYDPGANDNAFGVATLLSLARHFQEHPARFSVAFLTFSGEELGLLGSEYFSDHPLMNLSYIRFLINLDMVGNGSQGITVVNGSVYPDLFKTLTTINDQEKLLPVIKVRGEACNSDHCSFYRKGVPCFFIYAMGESKAYHDLDDRPDLIHGKGVEELMTLLIEFTKRL